MRYWSASFSMGKPLFKCTGTKTWLNFFLNNLFLKAVPQFSTSYIFIDINKLFNGFCPISLKFLVNEILDDKVIELEWKTFSMGKCLSKFMEAPRWFNFFQNSLVIKVVPQFSTNNIT